MTSAGPQLRARALDALREHEAEEERVRLRRRGELRATALIDLTTELQLRLGLEQPEGGWPAVWAGPHNCDPVVTIDGVRFRVEGRQLVAEVDHEGCGHAFQQTIGVHPDRHAWADLGIVVRLAAGDCRFCTIDAARAEAEPPAAALSPTEDLARALSRFIALEVAR